MSKSEDFYLWADRINCSFADGSWDKLLLSPDFDPFSPERWASPVSGQDGHASDALRNLHYGLTIAVIPPEHPYARRFVERGVEVAHRTLAEGPFLPTTGMFQKSSYDYKAAWLAYANGQLHLALALGESFLHAAPPGVISLRAASVGYLADAKNTPKGWHSHMDQSNYLFAVVCALLAGDVQHAKQLLKTRKRFTQVQRFHDLLQALTQVLVESGGQVLEPPHPVRAEFDTLLKARRSGRLREYTAEEGGHISMPMGTAVWCSCMALLKDRYLEGHTVPDWRRVLNYLVD